MAARIFNSNPIEKKICNFAVGVICHNLAKNGKIWRRLGRLEHPNIYILLIDCAENILKFFLLKKINKF